MSKYTEKDLHKEAKAAVHLELQLEEVCSKLHELYHQGQDARSGWWGCEELEDEDIREILDMVRNERGPLIQKKSALMDKLEVKTKDIIRKMLDSKRKPFECWSEPASTFDPYSNLKSSGYVGIQYTPKQIDIS